MQTAVALPSVRQLEVDGPELDATAARQLVLDAETCFRQGAHSVLIDLNAIETLNSLGLHALLAVKRRAPAGGRVVLARLTPYAVTLMRLARLHESFDIFSDNRSALASLLA